MLRAAIVVASLAFSTVAHAQPSPLPSEAPVSWARLAAERLRARARELAVRGDTAAAISAYTDAVRADPSYGRAYMELSELRLLFGNTQEAEWLLNRAVAQREFRGEALVRRAKFYRSLGRNELALRDLESAVELVPSPELIRDLAAVYVQQRAWAAALALWRRLRATLPAEPSTEARRAADETVLALSVLAAETDGARHDAGDRGWIRRALRRQSGR